MSNYKGHVAGGVVAFAMLVAFINTSTCSWMRLAEWFVFALGGALFPDIDIKSKGQKIFYRLLLIAMLFLLLQQRIIPVLFLGVTGVLPMVVKHRGIFHHPWFIVLLSAAPVVVAYLYWPRYVALLQGDAFFF